MIGPCTRHPEVEAAWLSGSPRFGAVVALAGVASLTGMLEFTRAQELGHDDPAKYLVAAFPDACPRGRRPSATPSGHES